MFKRSNITLIVIPEKGRKTFEFKISSTFVWLLGLCCVALLAFLPVGLSSYLDERELTQKAAQLEQDKILLEEQVGQIDRLEGMLIRLKRGNDQLRAILGQPDVLDEAASQPGEDPPYISSMQRLRWGHVQTVPTLWPLHGPVLRPFSEEHPSVVIAATAGSLVRASAAGQVMQASYDGGPRLCGDSRPRQRSADPIRIQRALARQCGGLRTQGAVHRALGRGTRISEAGVALRRSREWAVPRPLAL